MKSLFYLFKLFRRVADALTHYDNTPKQFETVSIKPIPIADKENVDNGWCCFRMKD